MHIAYVRVDAGCATSLFRAFAIHVRHAPPECIYAPLHKATRRTPLNIGLGIRTLYFRACLRITTRERVRILLPNALCVVRLTTATIAFNWRNLMGNHKVKIGMRRAKKNGYTIVQDG